LAFSIERRKKVDGSFEKTFLRILKRHLSHDFPNPKRIGCPPKQELDLLARQPTRVEAWVVKHLLGCSPCYLTYSKMLQKQKAKGAKGKPVRPYRRAAAGKERKSYK
jgi:hypothetical protein